MNSKCGAPTNSTARVGCSRVQQPLAFNNSRIIYICKQHQDLDGQGLSFSYSSVLLSLAFCIVDLTENIWDAISEIHLNFTDLHQWKFESSGIFSTRSPHRAFFIGAIHFESWKRLWKAWTPNKCKIFVWLVIHNRCWTADHLRRGLQPQTTAPSATKKMRQPNTYSLLVCMPGNSGSAFRSP